MIQGEDVRIKDMRLMLRLAIRGYLFQNKKESTEARTTD